MGGSLNAAMGPRRLRSITSVPSPLSIYSRVFDTYVDPLSFTRLPTALTSLRNKPGKGTSSRLYLVYTIFSSHKAVPSNSKLHSLFRNVRHPDGETQGFLTQNVQQSAASKTLKHGATGWTPRTTPCVGYCV